MLRIKCPYCGLRDHSEFEYGGDATVAWPALDAGRDAWTAAVYPRRDPKGPHREYWRHSFGCGLWLVVDRDTVTHEITAVSAADPAQGRALAAADPARDTAGEAS